ncbi:hypothetical protein [Clostridium pasteurianum]|uniref:hypothetical protein n=1 Tax=Clostridium pasteurianum TaxID=1501 RepID=UPI0012BC2B1E|nr:hypothetical protein [Clostridium pasteurianum]
MKIKQSIRIKQTSNSLDFKKLKSRVTNSSVKWRRHLKINNKQRCDVYFESYKETGSDDSQCYLKVLLT